MSAEVDFFWDDLLEHIEDGRVIPIIGAELLVVEHEGRQVQLYHYVAQRLAEQLRIPAQELPPTPTLNDVVCQYLERRGRREEVYPRIRAIMKEATFDIPPALIALAEIKPFDLFISVTFDSLLADAINRVRFGGAAKTQQLFYTPSNVQDLPCEKAEIKQPVVFHLLGKLSASPDYVITEEDTLEFLYSMQSDARRANLLFDELKNNHLLIIGCDFSDWLARFFIRIAKSRQLSVQRGEMEILVNSQAGADSNLMLFLRNFSYSTKVIPTSPLDFVKELSERFKARSAQKAALAPSPAQGAVDDDDDDDDDDFSDGEMQPGSIFISYAHEDVAAARRLRDFLDEAGLDVWLDKRRLGAGDDYGEKIRRNIKNCSFFLPILSENVEKRLEGYFRREWKMAEDRSLGIAEGVPFIVPVAVDGISDNAVALPERFRQVHWTRLPGGEGCPEFGMRMVKLMRDYRKRNRG
jgi:hypothetical protein